MQGEKIISALIGLIGACSNNPKTDDTDSLIIEALAYPASGCTEEELVERIHAEKNVIAPSCAVCATPCGNTSDYDMGRIFNAEKSIWGAKIAIIDDLRELATRVYKSKITLSEEQIFLLHKALAYVGYDLNVQALLDLSNELQQLKTQLTECGND